MVVLYGLPGSSGFRGRWFPTKAQADAWLWALPRSTQSEFQQYRDSRVVSDRAALSLRWNNGARIWRSIRELREDEAARDAAEQADLARLGGSPPKRNAADRVRGAVILWRQYTVRRAGDRSWRVDASVPGSTSVRSTGLYLPTQRAAQEAAAAIAAALVAFAEDNNIGGRSKPLWPLLRRRYEAEGRYGYYGVDEWVDDALAQRLGRRAGAQRTAMTGLTRARAEALIGAIDNAIADFARDNGLSESGPGGERTARPASADLARRLRRRGLDESAIYSGRSRQGAIPGITPKTNPSRSSRVHSHGFRRGDRVQMHPATDLWMRGARYGTVLSATADHVTVKLDALRRPVRVRASDLLPVY